MNHHDMSVRWHPIFVVLVSTSEPGQMLKITSIKLKSNNVIWLQPNTHFRSHVTWTQPQPRSTKANTHFRSHMTTTQNPLQKSHDYNSTPTSEVTWLQSMQYPLQEIHDCNHSLQKSHDYSIPDRDNGVKWLYPTPTLGIIVNKLHCHMTSL